MHQSLYLKKPKPKQNKKKKNKQTNKTKINVNQTWSADTKTIDWRGHIEELINAQIPLKKIEQKVAVASWNIL